MQANEVNVLPMFGASSIFKLRKQRVDLRPELSENILQCNFN